MCVLLAIICINAEWSYRATSQKDTKNTIVHIWLLISIFEPNLKNHHFCFPFFRLLLFVFFFNLHRTGSIGRFICDLIFGYGLFYLQVKCRTHAKCAAKHSLFSNRITSIYCITVTRNRTVATYVDAHSKSCRRCTITSVYTVARNRTNAKHVVSDVVHFALFGCRSNKHGTRSQINDNYWFHLNWLIDSVRFLSNTWILFHFFLSPSLFLFMHSINAVRIR